MINLIVSVSRRTDIPALYSEWFYNRIKEGYVIVRNPFNRKQLSKIILDNNMVECFIFWTKDPKNFMNKLELLEKYNYYFQFTVTAYRKDIEVSLRKKRDIIKTFQELSNKIGKEKVVWRYDPILINDYYTKEYHYKWFEIFANNLSGYTNKCTISFIDEYKETKKNSNSLNLIKISEKDMIEIASNFVRIGEKYGIKIESCGEKVNLESYGVEQGACIDAKFISQITGNDTRKYKKDNMRKTCNCIKSVDIGEYNSCVHNCRYCYANYNSSIIQNNYNKHDKNSPILIGNITADDKVTLHNLCKSNSKKYNQLTLFKE